MSAARSHSLHGADGRQLPQRRSAHRDAQLRAVGRYVARSLCRVTQLLSRASSADDIVRARLRTLGVEEHRFTMESGK